MEKYIGDGNDEKIKQRRKYIGDETNLGFGNDDNISSNCECIGVGKRCETQATIA